KPRLASILGASEVAMAITMATLTTVVVFVPLMLMTGNVAMTFYLSRMGVPVIVMLVGSLFVALLFIPLAAVRFGGTEIKSDPRSIGWARRKYGFMLAWVLKHRRDAILISLVLLATIVIPSGKLKRSDSGGGNINDVDINVYPPNHFSVVETYDLMKEIEDFLNSNREVYGIRTIRMWFRSNRGSAQIFLNSDANQEWWYVAYKDLRVKLGYPVDLQMSRTDVIQDLKENMPKFVGVRIGVNTWGSGGGDPSVSVYLYGEDTEVLAGMVEEVERRLQSIPSVVSVDTDLERSNDEVQVQMDRDRARRYGISPQVVARTLAFSLQGVSLPRYQAGQREVDARLYLEEVDRQTLHQLKGFTFRSSAGEEIPLAELATIKVAQGMGTIRREDGKTRLSVRAFTTKDDLKELYLEVDRAMTGFDMPRGYSWNKGERFDKFQESNDETMFAVVMAITCVFLLMGVLFESVILPFSVLLSIPFAFLGVYWTLYLTGTPMDMMANIGVIVLIGVVVNNAIVLVDMVNRMRQEGLSRTDAILEAGHNRFRPILMTTFTAVFGLLPMAVGNTNLVGMPYAPLGRTMMGGLLVSTFLTLLVVPLFYTLLDDLRLGLGRIFRAAFSGSEPAPYGQVQPED
ncbi:MAG: efflux RND transporter permease subunit, partial [bacterium]|nr:efflux RND transporter permease subunit [bacterium]